MKKFLAIAIAVVGLLGAVPARADGVIREIRAQGYTLSIEDVVPDVCALGAPVFDQSGVAVAAISVGGYRERFQPRLRAISSAVVSAAQTLSTRLGAHPPRRQADQHERFPAGASRRRRA